MGSEMCIRDSVKDAATDSYKVPRVNASTDPIFQDTVTINTLEHKVGELEQMVLKMLGQDATISDLQKQIRKLEKMCGVANLRYKKSKQDSEELKMALRILKEEADNLREDLNRMNDDERVDERINSLHSKLGIY